MELKCYKCGNRLELLVEETIDNETGKVVDKKFVCVDCSQFIKKLEERKYD